MLWATIVLMLAGMALTLFTPLWLVVPGMLVFTFGFFGAHLGRQQLDRTPRSESQGAGVVAVPVLLLRGSSIAGTAGGFFWHFAGWNGIGGFIVALLIGALLVALKLAKLPPLGNMQT